MLLRLGGVPARYVTGYVPSESHSGGEWLARRKDGHAWVEAYDRQTHQWVRVEATPSSGLPDRRDATGRPSGPSAGASGPRTSGRGFSSSERGPHWALSCRLPWPVCCSDWCSSQPGSSSLENIVASRSGAERRAGHHLSPNCGNWMSTFPAGFRTPTGRDPPAVSRPRGSFAASQTLQPILDWYGVYSDIRYDEAGRTTEKLGELEAAWQRIPQKPR